MSFSSLTKDMQKVILENHGLTLSKIAFDEGFDRFGRHKISLQPGVMITRSIDKLCKRANLTGEHFTFEANGVCMTVHGKSDSNERQAYWDRKMNENRKKYRAKISTRENRRAFQRQFEEAEDKKAQLRADVENQPITFANQVGWDAGIAANQDAAGEDIFKAATYFAKMLSHDMEAGMTLAETLEANGNEYLYACDGEGLTRFMFNFGIKHLAYFWDGTDTLRPWCNKNLGFVDWPATTTDTMEINQCEIVQDHE